MQALQLKSKPETTQQNGLVQDTAGVPKMLAYILGTSQDDMGAEILHATKMRNLVVRRGAAKCPANAQQS